ncbi:MAG: hypothetical protein Q6370_018860 [Candidatus Sigynarchaeota archaeon]
MFLDEEGGLSGMAAARAIDRLQATGKIARHGGEIFTMVPDAAHAGAGQVLAGQATAAARGVPALQGPAQQLQQQAQQREQAPPRPGDPVAEAIDKPGSTYVRDLKLQVASIAVTSRSAMQVVFGTINAPNGEPNIEHIGAPVGSKNYNEQLTAIVSSLQETIDKQHAKAVVQLLNTYIKTRNTQDTYTNLLRQVLGPGMDTARWKAIEGRVASWDVKTGQMKRDTDIWLVARDASGHELGRTVLQECKSAKPPYKNPKGDTVNTWASQGKTTAQQLLKHIVDAAEAARTAGLDPAASAIVEWLDIVDIGTPWTLKDIIKEAPSDWNIDWVRTPGMDGIKTTWQSQIDACLAVLNNKASTQVQRDSAWKVLQDATPTVLRTFGAAYVFDKYLSGAVFEGGVLLVKNWAGKVTARVLQSTFTATPNWQGGYMDVSFDYQPYDPATRTWLAPVHMETRIAPRATQDTYADYAAKATQFIGFLNAHPALVATLTGPGLATLHQVLAAQGLDYIPF